MPVFAVYKPLGLTSHDVVARARRLLGTKKVGHTGTLDPLATGVLMLCTEEATKLVQFMEKQDKEYIAWVSFGAATPTLDAEGPISEMASVPSLETLRGKLEQQLPLFLGKVQQVPPQYSALQVGGKRAYAVAREGGSLDLPAREVWLHELELLDVFSSMGAAPDWMVEVAGGSFAAPLPPALGEFPTALIRARVGSGTYLRSLARDLGAVVGCPAHLAGLLRTSVGGFSLSQSVLLENLPDTKGLPMLEALHLPVLEVDEKMALSLRQGKRPSATGSGRCVAVCGGELVAVVEEKEGQWRVLRAWQG